MRRGERRTSACRRKQIAGTVIRPYVAFATEAMHGPAAARLRSAGSDEYHAKSEYPLDCFAAQREVTAPACLVLRSAVFSQLAPHRCSEADEIVFKVALDEPAAVVLSVPLTTAEPLFESVG